MRILAVAVLLAATASVAAEPQPSAGCKRESIERGRRLVQKIDVAGTPREVILDVPDSVKPGTPAPVLLDFHGFGHSGAGVWTVSGFKALAEREGFITAYPEGLPIHLTVRGEELDGAGWKMDAVEGNRDVAFTTALLDQLERDYCVDHRRVYSTGFSNGAFFSQLLACALSGRIAAVAPVSGGTLRFDCHPARPVPILIQNGSEDELVPVASARETRDRWKTLNGCKGEAAPDGAACQRWTECRGGATVEYCEEPYGHRWQPQATDRVWAFLSSKILP
jgi:polyhydroxybutyrate depolymerase